jgi:protoheme ferro-lyase
VNVDMQAATIAQECGLDFQRTESLNDSPAFIALLETLVRDSLTASRDGLP